MTFPGPFYRWRPHPWHGLEVGASPPVRLNAYIELTPFDLVKYEIDKTTGYLRVDRPQHGSSQPPTLYGFIPRTFCGDRIRRLCPEAQAGDGDPLDVCVLSERPIARSEVILSVRVIGGLQILDGGEADDKIIAVLEGDRFWADAERLDDVPAVLIERLRHYFRTYKALPDSPAEVALLSVYGVDHAKAVVEAAIADYAEAFGT